MVGEPTVPRAGLTAQLRIATTQTGIALAALAAAPSLPWRKRYVHRIAVPATVLPLDAASTVRKPDRMAGPDAVVNADVVVVGGGSSGAVVAARMAEAGVRVTLLEAGPDYGPLAGRPADGSRTAWPADLLNAHAIALSHDWGYESGPVAGRAPWTFERARVIGRCSAHNGAIAAVGHAADYDGWGLPEWRTDMLRSVFATVLDKMRVRAYRVDEAGPFHVRCLEAASGTGWEIASDLCDLDANESFGLETVNIVDGVRWNTAFAYLDPVRHRANLTIVDRVLVDPFVEDRSGVTVHAWRNGDAFTIRAGRVVLSTGVYGTPAILQRSGVGDPERLCRAGVACVLDRPGAGVGVGGAGDRHEAATRRSAGRSCTTTTRSARARWASTTTASATVMAGCAVWIASRWPTCR